MKVIKKKVFVAMSGGVDSSVAAFLLKKRGYDVVGIFMKCFNVDGCEERDAEDARRVAEKLEIPFYVWDFEEEYKKKVVEYIVEGYKKGITPNPDVECNREIKFGLFLKRALRIGARYVATGHYVKIKNSKLFQAKDKNKDQSYFLWTLRQEQLRHCLFPVGNYLKSEVRRIAKRVGLPTAEKKDSQGICFLGKVSIADFLKKYIKEKKGDVLLMTSVRHSEASAASRRISGDPSPSAQDNVKKYQKIGQHCGAQFYTIGQRHGLNIGGFEKPLYVVSKNVKKNILVVAEGDDNPALYKKEIKLANVNWIDSGFKMRDSGTMVYARVRYRQPLVKAKITYRKSLFIIHFDEPQKFIAPGQSAVFYSPVVVKTMAGKEMLGGGIIV